MFENAIEKVLQFTRPMHTISRTYGGMIQPGSSTFFFVNDQGVAVTCKHVLDLIPSADNINNQFNQFKAERNKIPQDGKFKRNLMGLEMKYKYNPETTVQLKNNFLNCFDKIEQIVCHAHPTLDLAILEFKGFDQTFYQSNARFIRDSNKIRQGKSLCRIGFPFPEFNNFRHNPEADDIEWTNTGNPNSPSFPIDGIVTRFAAEPNVGITGIEMSTPGLRGQSGGPLFDEEGNIYGMQFATKHLHLGFDMKDAEIITNGKKSKVSNFPFLHVGMCIHVDKIKEFLDQHQVRYSLADV
ncbi:MAG: trypsin-like peptidase domain-containing protein [Chitinophagaceae bacterium]|nr:trypsin-like peptidase domain-containing protein [Chitinophagaceae bacterium]MBL0054770.1 trypsin-like peptidase domain-containing protein [Chitinophagaceae bacterium]